MNNKIINNTKSLVKAELEWLCSAHDFYHIERVWKLAQKIYAKEKIWDLLVIELGALLHESFDRKFYNKEQLEDKKISLEKFFSEQWLDKDRIEKVFFVIKNVGFGKSLIRTKDFIITPEFAIVEDADRLEAIWAIAIARTFSYWGKKQRPIHDPNIDYEELVTEESYNNGSPSSVAHFYEKLLKLKDILNTPTAKELAKERHIFMEQFLKQFYAEWDLEV